MHILGELLTSIFILLVGCGYRGTGENSQPPVSTDIAPVPTDKSAPTTYVLTDILPYLQPESVGCLRADEQYGELPKLEQLHLDGEIDEWVKVPLALVDPLGDSDSSFDIGTVSVARMDADLAVAVAIQPDQATELIFEFGGVLLRDTELDLKVRKMFRLKGTELFELVSNRAIENQWRKIDLELFQIAKGSSGLELLIREKALGDVLVWPAFWMKIYSQSEDFKYRTFDSASSVVFASVLANESTNLTFSSCYSWRSESIPIHLRFVIDRATLDNSRHQIEPSDSVAVWVSSIVRSGFEAAGKEIGGLVLPVSETTIYVVNAEFQEKIESLGSEHRPDRAYDGLILDSRELIVGASEFFPEGKIFAAATAHIVRLDVLGRFPIAPSYWVNIITQALVDRIIQNNLGLSYWLDHYYDHVAQFMSRSDARSPKPISSANWHSKEQAFAHLLSTKFNSQELRGAWIRAADLAKAGESYDSAVLAALEEVTQSNDVRRWLASLWPGWIAEGGYHKDLGPEQISDHDFDGLPTFWELGIGTHFDRADSDSDGWTDYAEVISGGDPLAATINPSVLVPDGNFADWLELMPKKLIIDRGHSGSCPQAADISHYAAVVGNENLLVGAYSSDFLEDEPAAYWEIVVDLPIQQRQLLVGLTAGSRQFTVRDSKSGAYLLVRERAPSLGRGTVEIPLARLDLGLQPWTIEREGLRLRVRTIFRDHDAEIFCDETGWFTPEFNQ